MKSDLFSLLQTAGTFGRLATRKNFSHARTQTHAYKQTDRQFTRLNKKKRNTLYKD